MKPLLLFVLALGIPSAGGAKLDRSANLPLIEDLDRVIQKRLTDPAPKVFGMSRVMIRPYSMGEHFAPVSRNGKDFAPENDDERKVVAALEARKLQVGLYLFGEDVTRDDADKLNYRALKGPGVITANTPRPSWYPSRLATLPKGKDVADRLADWARIYPVAQRAMRSFKDGGKGFELELDGWTIAARPALATDDRCVACHRHQNGASTLRRGEAVGGILYAFRPTPLAP